MSYSGSVPSPAFNFWQAKAVLEEHHFVCEHFTGAMFKCSHPYLTHTFFMTCSFYDKAYVRRTRLGRDYKMDSADMLLRFAYNKE